MKQNLVSSVYGSISNKNEKQACFNAAFHLPEERDAAAGNYVTREVTACPRQKAVF